VAGIVALAVLVTVPFWASSASIHTLIDALTLLALAQMWNLLAGYAGLVSIGQQAFVGLGAYGLFILGDKAGIHPFLAVVIGAFAATAIAVPTAALAFRLRGGYFAIGTWVIAEVYRLVISNISELGSGTGTTVSSAAELGRETRDNGAYWLALAAGAGAVLVVYLILRSRLGLALTAIRDNETGARSLGVDVLRAKVIVYLVAAFGCAFAGGVIYLNLLRIQPDAAFTVNWTVYMIFIVVIGGIGTIEGPILGTAVFFVLQELLADYGVWYLVALGAVAVIVMLWAPGGLWSLVQRRFDLRLFPVQRRVRFAPVGKPAGAGTDGVTPPAGPP
jgi:branched-chain amino acid transport system permease protein